MKTAAFRASRLIAACFAFVVTVLALPPWLPAMPAAGLDPSWTLVLSHAFNNAWAFGSDIVMTYGPYGFLATNLFDPANYAIVLIYWVGVALLLAATVIVLADQRPGLVVTGTFLIVLALRAAIVMTPPANGQVFADPLFFLLPLLLLAADLRTPSIGPWLRWPLVAVIAVSGLVKFTFALVALPIVVLIDLHRWTRRQFVPVHVIAYMVLLATFFLVAGQRLTTFPAYVITSLQIASGYTGAMQKPGNPDEITRFLGAAAGVALLVGLAEWRADSWRRRDWSGTVLLTGFAVVVFLTFKAGFVRHDIHTLIAWSTLAAAAPICAGRQLRAANDRRWSLAMLALCVFIAAATVTTREQQTGQPFWPFVNATFGGGLVARAASAAGMVGGWRIPDLRAEREAALAAIRRDNPLPPLGGSVDIYPWDAAVVLAHGLDYRPRPVFQSYIAYTAPLMTLNSRHLSGPAAADKVLFAIETLDNRFPSLDDAEAWPQLLARYDGQGMLGRQLLLQRRAAPRPIVWRELGSATTTWFERVPVPSTAGPIWASIAIDPTLTGALMNVLFKLPAIGLAVEAGNGNGRIYRLVPAVARQGFLLSPVVDATERFAALARGDLGAAGPPVRAIELLRTVDAAPYYAAAIHVDFRALEIR